MIITAIPMYHIFALTVNGLLMFSTGCKECSDHQCPGYARICEGIEET